MYNKQKTYRNLDMDKIKNRITKTISTGEALKDVVPIQWSNDVLTGKRKITLTKYK